MNDIILHNYYRNTVNWFEALPKRNKRLQKVKIKKKIDSLLLLLKLFDNFVLVSPTCLRCVFKVNNRKNDWFTSTAWDIQR